MEGTIGMGGQLGARVMRPQAAPVGWRLRNRLRPAYLWGWLCNLLAVLFTRLTGIPTITSELRVQLIRAGVQVLDFGVVDRRLVTQNGVGFIIDDWDDDTTDITAMNYHASGTGTTAASNTDTALETEATTVTDRATGNKTQPAYNQLQTVGTQSFTGSAVVTEHGLLSSATEGAGVLWDRHTFAAINVGSGDSIQWTYMATINAET